MIKYISWLLVFIGFIFAFSITSCKRKVSIETDIRNAGELDSNKLLIIPNNNSLFLCQESSDNVIHDFSFDPNFEKHTYFFKNGNVCGILPVKDAATSLVDIRNLTCPCELFFCDAQEKFEVLENNLGWRYKTVYAEQDDSVWVLFSDFNEGRLFKISNTGQIGDTMMFHPEITADTMRLILADGKPVKIVLNTIEADVQYKVDVNMHTITFIRKNMHDYNGAKP